MKRTQARNLRKNDEIHHAGAWWTVAAAQIVTGRGTLLLTLRKADGAERLYYYDAHDWVRVR